MDGSRCSAMFDIHRAKLVLPCRLEFLCNQRRPAGPNEKLVRGLFCRHVLFVFGDFSLANPSTFSLSLRQHPQASISSLLFILSSMFCVNPSTFSNRYPNTHRQQVIDVFHPFIDVLHQSIDVFPALPKHPQATIHRCFSTFHRYFHPIEFEPRAKKPSIPGCMAAIPGGLVAIPGP